MLAHGLSDEKGDGTLANAIPHPNTCLLSKCGFATLLNPLGGRTTYVVGLGALSGAGRGMAPLVSVFAN